MRSRLRAKEEKEAMGDETEEARENQLNYEDEHTSVRVVRRKADTNNEV